MKGKIIKSFGTFEVGKMIDAPESLLIELQIDGYVEVINDSQIENQLEPETKKRGRKPNV